MPPLPLANRVGGLEEADDPYAFYEQVGADTREQILRMLPAGYELEGRRLLDFGCGAGRTLRHFLDEAHSAEIWGCDIDHESVDWLQHNLCPPLHVLRNAAAPDRLPFEDGHFDVAWALSVFTHLADTWAAWMLELHRLLADDGILIATSIGPQHSEVIAQEPWEEDRIGMNALRHWASWEVGGPMVLHSTWWLRAHWGRAFEIVEIDDTPLRRGALQPSLARNEKARCDAYRRGSRAPGARRAARVHRRASQRSTVAARARSGHSTEVLNATAAGSSNRDGGRSL